MKYYIAYKFSGVDKANLKKVLVDVAEIIESYNNTTFISHRDLQNWGETITDSKEIIIKSLTKLKNTDAILCLVLSGEKSEGMLIEVGYAKALGKKIIVAKQKDARIVFLKDIADDLIEFDIQEDLNEKLKEYFIKNQK